MTIQRRLDCVLHHVSNVLLQRSSSSDRVCLVPDAIDVGTRRPFIWRCSPDPDIVSSNFSCQQLFLRTLSIISTITGNTTWVDTAKDIVKWRFLNQTDSTGLFKWGSHQTFDLVARKAVGIPGKPSKHELKNVFPFYKLMYETDFKATERLVLAIWNTHVVDWELLTIDRHGKFERQRKHGWPVIRQGAHSTLLGSSKGLSFINAGSDLIWAAGCIGHLSSKPQPVGWALALAEKYYNARHPKTGLGAYQFTKAAVRDYTSDDDCTDSKFGDRAYRQLGPEMGDDAVEANVLRFHEAKSIYSENALMQLELGHLLGASGRKLTQWTLEGLHAFANRCYDGAVNSFIPVLADGRSLAGVTLKRNGYYGAQGNTFAPYSADYFFPAYARAFRLTEDLPCGRMACDIASGIGLVRFRHSKADYEVLDVRSDLVDPRVLVSCIDMYYATKRKEWLNAAAQVADNIISRFYSSGWFLERANGKYAKPDSIYAYAVAQVCAAQDGYDIMTERYLGGCGTLHGTYVDGNCRTHSSMYLDTILGDEL